MNYLIDLRSDTVTLPPPEMRQAIAAAELGDDVYGEDPTVNALESLAARMLGKQAAIFVPSGTMANLLALMGHCSLRKRLLVGDLSDIWRWEAGGASVLGGLVYHTLSTRPNGELSLEDIEAAVYGHEDFQCVPAGLICLEDTHCLCGGRALSLEYLAQVYQFGCDHNVPVHLDGARIFNAAIALGVSASQIAAFADTVSVCLSKGLAAPVGSLVAGCIPFITQVRRLRKMVGGGMRQAGVLAAAGIYALEHMVNRLAEDHANARLLAEKLARIPGIQIDPEPPQTNIVFWTLADQGLSSKYFMYALQNHGVHVAELGKGKIRAVTHYGITAKDIECAVGAVRSVLALGRSALSRTMDESMPSAVMAGSD
ncbi:MAG TPA: low-specificity L-threonine aldolase [Candidatus Angelobacter sp.]|nr:low-specificity L-threonine aldolase [Candidatus Angelobacter sp.]